MKYALKVNKKTVSPSFMKKRNLVWPFALVLVCLHVYFAVQMSSMGARIALYEDEAIKIKNENNDLSSRLIDTMSLTKLNQKSQDMGFRKIETTYFLKLGESFAEARK